jgi:RES domain-containing protein
MLVRIDRADIPAHFRLLTIEVPETSSNIRIGLETLPIDWRSDYGTTQQIGTELLDRTAHLTITVPSALAPFTWNVLLNPRHPDIQQCAIVGVTEESFDPRLIR